MKKIKALLSALLVVIALPALAQTQGGFRDEASIYAETKQVNQFFRRFNNEETVNGDRLYKGDPEFRNNTSRLKYLNILFDQESPAVLKLKQEFIDQVTRKRPFFLNFHGGNWFAQVNTVFSWHGKEEKLVLFLKLQEEKIGAKWVICNVNFPPFKNAFNKDTANNKFFLHPLSHEVDFMNLFRVFQDNKDHIEDYTSKEFSVDQLSMFLFETKKSNLVFKTVTDVKFHFFQVDNWYFELSKFNRSGNNNGWLISNLVKIKGDEKEKLRQFIINRQE